EALGDRAHDEQIERLETSEDVHAKAWQQHVLFQVVFVDLLLEMLAELSFAENHEPGVRDLADDEMSGVHEIALSFVRYERGDVADNRRAVRRKERLMEVQ